MACQHYETYQRRRAQRGNEREKMWFAMLLITGAQPSPKAGTGLKMQTVRFFNVTLLGIYR